MRMLIDESELKERRCRDEIPFECIHCKTTFHLTKNYALNVRNGKKYKNSKLVGCFCSQICNRAYIHATHPRSKNVNCKQCGVEFSRINSQLRKSKNYFCGKSCAVTYNNTHKTRGIRRSKLEVYLEIQLTERYPDIELHFNRKDTIQSELDIYIPGLNLAVELNGIFHYEPIFGNDKLGKIQSNDGRKFQACLEKKIELCIIDTSKQTYFKEKSSNEFLGIITELMDRKISQNLVNG